MNVDMAQPCKFHSDIPGLSSVLRLIMNTINGVKSYRVLISDGFVDYRHSQNNKGRT